MLAVVVSVDPDQLELASDALWGLGALAVEERDGDAGLELWTSLGNEEHVVRQALQDLHPAWPWRLVEVADSVVDTWREFAQPTWVADDLVLVPAWVTIDVPPAVTAVYIEPGATFGLGDHPTTGLCLLGLRPWISATTRLLDVGCGSGVLAVAACMLGAASTEAVDISPASVPTATANAERNGVADRVSVSTRLLSEVDGEFDVVVANILAPTLIAMADDLRRLVGREGTLVISGLLAGRSEHVVEELAPLVVVDRCEADGWTAITLRHAVPSSR